MITAAGVSSSAYSSYRDTTLASDLDVLLASPVHPAEELHWNALGQRSIPQYGCKRNKELWCSLTTATDVFFRHLIPQEAGLDDKKIYCFFAFKWQMSSPVSPAGTKLTKWRQSDWFSWYPAAGTILLHELLTHAVVKHEFYFSMKASQARSTALQKSSAEPSDVLEGKMQIQHSDAVGF